MTPTVSIAIAAFRGEKYLPGLLKSLQDQTLFADEIIITDDSPDDSTLRAISGYLTLLPIRYFRNPEQLGINRNFEKAISLCTADIIFCCDQDDVWLPEKCRLLSAALQQNPGVSGVFCNSQLTDEQLNPLPGTLWEMRRFQPDQLSGSGQLARFLRRVPCSGHNLAFRREVRVELLPFPELEPFFFDTHIGLSLAVQNRWTAVDLPLTLYRVHQNNASKPQGSLMQNLASGRRARAGNMFFRSSILAGELLKRYENKLSESEYRLLEEYRKHSRRRSLYSRNFFRRTGQIICNLPGYRNCRTALSGIVCDWLFPPGNTALEEVESADNID